MKPFEYFQLDAETRSHKAATTIHLQFRVLTDLMRGEEENHAAI